MDIFSGAGYPDGSRASKVPAIPRIEEVAVRALNREFSIAGKNRLAPVWIIGPDVIEDGGFALEVAEVLAEIAKRRSLSLVYKASYEKANRSSASSFRGPGLSEGLEILAAVKEKTGLPITTDVHCEEDARVVGEIVDVIQIPAFLCRQNRLLEAAAATGKVVNMKKGQFLSPWDIPSRVEVLRDAGAADVWVTERGSSFGYQRLINDMRVVPVVQETGAALIFDGTHSVQTPGGPSGTSGGERSFIPVLVRAAAAAGAQGFFLEVHPDPPEALCDGPNALPLDQLESLLDQVEPIIEAVRKVPDLDLQD